MGRPLQVEPNLGRYRAAVLLPAADLRHHLNQVALMPPQEALDASVRQ